MYAVYPTANQDQAQSERPIVMSAESSGFEHAVRQFFRPYVLACLAVALAVGGWGYGYKLTQYLQHFGATKASATRMWVEHRDEGLAAPIAKVAKPHKLFGAACFALTIPPVPHFSRDLVVTPPVPSRITIFVSAHNPLRAPPTLNSLA